MSTYPILSVPDLHLPWTTRRCLRWLYTQIEIIRPKIIVQHGDLYDLFSHYKIVQRHPKMTAEAQVERGREMAEHMWAAIKKRAPNAKCFQLRGNHDDRPIKRMTELYGAGLSAFQPKELWTFDGVETMQSERDELILGGIAFIHGFKNQGAHCREMLMPVVRAHDHKGGVYFKRVWKRLIWELDCGFLANRHALALSYTRQKKWSNWMQGIGVIWDYHRPQFVPKKVQG